MRRYLELFTNRNDQFAPSVHFAPLRARRDETELQALMALLQRRQGPGLLLGGVEGINLQDSRTWSSCRWTARPNRALNPA